MRMVSCWASLDKLNHIAGVPTVSPPLFLNCVNSNLLLTILYPHYVLKSYSLFEIISLHHLFYNKLFFSHLLGQKFVYSVDLMTG